MRTLSVILFRPNTKEWDEERIQLAFSHTDAIAVLQTRIPQNPCADRLAWSISNDGRYSVKSGYYFWQTSNGTSPQTDQTTGWKRLWRLTLPHKFKIFLWRFCKNTIPVRNQLRHKGVSVPILCPLCGTDVEHMLHVFSDCDFATQCWQQAGLVFDMRNTESVPSWLLSKLAVDTQDNLVTIAAVLWGIWFARNRRVWEGKVMAPELAVQWSLKQIHDWKNAVRTNQNSPQGTGRGNLSYNAVQWQCPEEGVLKVNVDASVFPGSDSFSIGIVVRDHTGSFRRGKTMRFMGCVTVFEAEAVGMLEALSWVFDLTELPMIVETDSLMVVNALQKHKPNHLEVGNVLEACSLALARKNNIRLAHVKKLANKVAHLMARLPCALNSYNVYESPPHTVLETIGYDLRKV